VYADVGCRRYLRYVGLGILAYDLALTLRLDVSLPLNGSIDRSSPSWTTNLLNEYTNTINAFNKVRPDYSGLWGQSLMSQYDNILAYNIGNEVINLVSNTNAARRSSIAIIRWES
jgi:hypothetical protein